MKLNEPYLYQERIVAFIDILGFRSFVNETIDKKSWRALYGKR